MRIRNARRLTALALTLAAATGTLATATAPASAATVDCSGRWAHPNSSDGTAKVSGSGVNYRTGPDQNTCSVLGSWGLGTSVYLWCWTRGNYVSNGQEGWDRWWYVRRAGTSQQGWIAAVYLNSFTGTEKEC